METENYLYLNLKSLQYDLDESWVKFVDLLFCEYIYGVAFIDEEIKGKYSDLMLKSIDGGGYFYDSFDEKKHNKYHLTAYGLAAVNILNLEFKYPSVSLLEDLIASNFEIESARFLDKVHFWRGSHDLAGKASIVLQLKDMNLVDESNKTKAVSFLDSWSLYYKSKINQNGLWISTNFIVQFAFDSIYQLKHNPVLAKYGAAAHFYWVLNKYDKSYKKNVDSNILTSNILKLYKKHGYILEKVPYCLDYDLLCILNSYDHGELSKEVDDLLFNVGVEIYSFLVNKNDQLWFHAYPGALAALYECSKSVRFKDYLSSKGIFLKNIFDKVTWL